MILRAYGPVDSVGLERGGCRDLADGDCLADIGCTGEQVS
jgi:hypothetical protein